MKVNELILLDPENIICDGEWLFWKEEPSPWFIDSFKEIGQIFPVIVTKEKEGFILITGYKRVKTCKILNIKVEAKVITADIIKKGLIYLFSNLSRNISLPTLIIAFRFFKRHMTEDLKPIIGRLENFFDSRKLYNLNLWLKLPEKWDFLLLEDKLDIDFADKLVRFPEEDLEYLFLIFSSIKWSYGNTKKLLKMIWDLKVIKKTEIINIFESIELTKTLNSNLSPKDKIETILKRLKEKRYPILSQLEEEFSVLRKKFDKSTLLKIIPEKNFEGDKLYLNAEIQSLDDLLKIKKELDNFIDSSLWKEIKKWQKKRLDRL